MPEYQEIGYAEYDARDYAADNEPDLQSWLPFNKEVRIDRKDKTHREAKAQVGQNYIFEDAFFTKNHGFMFFMSLAVEGYLSCHHCK